MVAQTRVAGRYELKGLLGEGGMGVVYRAFDTKTKSDVAIKTMRDVADPVAAELFAKEWSVLAGLSHPNIVDIRDVGEIEDGNSRRPFFVMPLLPGVTLGKLIETSSARLTLERVVEIIKQVCRGLQAAHEQGIVHRDLKPSNIFVMDDDTAKIIDFGVVYLAGSNTVTGHKGTWQYMAPEQAQLQAATPASDIFSLGVVCYEALTGRKPFARKTPAETAEAARKFVPPPVSEVNSVVPHVVSMVVHKAMAKQPMHRFSSARDFSDTLVKAFHNEPIERFDTARIRPRLERARKASADGDHAFASEILAELEAEGHIDPEISLVRSQIDVAVRQKRVRQLLESARTRLEQDEIPLALEKVREALELDPDNAPVLGLRAEIEKQRNARQIQNWIQLAREHLDRRNYAEARQAVDEVLRIRSDDSHALRLAGEIKLREQESKRIRLEKEQLYGAALKSYQNGEISTALSKLERVLVLAREMPDATVPERDAAYQNLYNQIRSERDAIQNAYAESRRNVAEKNFGRALEICDQFLAKYPADALLQALRLQVVEAQRQDLSAYIAEVGKRAESEPDLDRRANILKEACERYPQEQQFQQSLRLTRERRDLVQGIAAKARQYEERGQFTEAVGQWDILRNIHPQYLGIDYEVEQLVRRRDRQALDDEKARIVTQIDCALEAGSFARARELAFNALSEFPNDQELSTLERLARQGVERSEEAKRLLAEGQKLCAEGRTKEGIERFERGVGIDDRNDPIRGVLVGTLLEQARSLLDTDLPEAERYTRRAADLDGAHPGVRSLGSLIADATRKEMVAKCLAEARELQAAGNIAAAVEQVEAQLSESQNDARLLQYRATLQNLVREERQRGERREDAAAIERLRSEQRAGSAEARTTLDRAALERAEAIRRRYPDDPQIAAAAADIRQRYISLSPQDDFSNLVPSEYRAGEVAMPGAAVPRTGSESPLAVAPPARERLKVIGSQLARLVEVFKTGMQGSQLKSGRDRIERAAAIRTILDRAELLLKQGQANIAVALLQAASKDYSADIEMGATLERAQASKKSQERQSYIASQVSLAEEYERRGELTPGLSVLRNALAQYPAAPELIAAEQRMEFVQSRIDGNRRIAGEIAAIERNLKDSDWGSALEGAQRARAQFPEHAAFATIEALVAEACKNLQTGSAEDPEHLVQTVLERSPSSNSDDHRLLQFSALLKATLKRAIDNSEHRRNEFVTLCLEEVRKLQSAGNLEAALAQVEQGLFTYPQAESLRDMEGRLREALEDSRRKRAEDVNVCLAQACELETAGCPEEALSCIEQALSLYPGDRDLMQLRSKLQRTAQVTRHKRDTLVSQVRELQAAGDLHAALRCAEKAVTSYPHEPRLLQLSTAIEAAIQERGRAQEESVSWCIEQAQKLRSRGDLQGALAQIEEGLASNPHETKLKEIDQLLIEEIEQSRRKRDELILSCIAEARKLQEAGEIKAALAKIEEGLAVYPGEQRLLPMGGSLRKTVKRKRDEFVTLCIARARELQEAGNLQGALNEVERGLASYQDDNRLAELRLVLSSALDDSLRRKEQSIERFLNEAQALQGAGSPAKALEQIGQGLAAYPAEARLRERELRLRGALKELGRKRDECVLGCLAEAQKLRAAGDLKRAISHVREGLSAYPEEPGLLEAAASLQKLLSDELRKRDELITACLTEVRKLQASGDLPAAIDRVQQGLASFPDDDRLRQQRDTLQAALKESLQKRDEFVSRCSREIRQLQSSGDLKGALGQIEQALSFYPGEPNLVGLHGLLLQAYEEYRGKQNELVMQCLMRARQLEAKGDLKGALGEIDQSSLTYPGEPRLVQARAALYAQFPKAWYRRPAFYLPAFLILTVSASVVALYPRRPPITVEHKPAVLDFSVYRIGSPPPGPLEIEWNDSGVPFTAMASDPWITVAPEKGERLGRLQVRIDPTGLGPGHKSGNITVRPATDAPVVGSLVVPVSIDVEQGPKPPPPPPGEPALKVDRQSLALKYQIGDPSPAPEQIHARQGRVLTCTPSANWLKARQNREGCTVWVEPAGLVSGHYASALALKGAGGNDVSVSVTIEITPTPVVSPKNPDPPPPPAPKRISKDQYSGSPEGDLIWNGALPSNGELRLDASGSAKLSGPGTLGGRHIPLVELRSLEITARPEGVRVDLGENGIVIQNTTSVSINRIVIHWKVKD